MPSCCTPTSTRVTGITSLIYFYLLPSTIVPWALPGTSTPSWASKSSTGGLEWLPEISVFLLITLKYIPDIWFLLSFDTSESLSPSFDNLSLVAKLPCLLRFKFALHVTILFASFVCMYFYAPLGINYCKKKKTWFLFIVAFVCQIIPVWSTSLHRGLVQKWDLLTENNLTGERLEVANSNGFRGKRSVQTYYIILQMFIQRLLCMLATI